MGSLLFPLSKWFNKKRAVNFRQLLISLSFGGDLVSQVFSSLSTFGDGALHCCVRYGREQVLPPLYDHQSNLIYILIKIFVLNILI